MLFLSPSEPRAGTRVEVLVSEHCEQWAESTGAVHCLLTQGTSRLWDTLAMPQFKDVLLQSGHSKAAGAQTAKLRYVCTPARLAQCTEPAAAWVPALGVILKMPLPAPEAAAGDNSSASGSLAGGREMTTLCLQMQLVGAGGKLISQSP
jgi:hypothetical protein